MFSRDTPTEDAAVVVKRAHASLAGAAVVAVVRRATPPHKASNAILPVAFGNVTQFLELLRRAPSINAISNPCWHRETIRYVSFDDARIPEHKSTKAKESNSSLSQYRHPAKIAQSTRQRRGNTLCGRDEHDNEDQNKCAPTSGLAAFCCMVWCWQWRQGKDVGLSPLPIPDVEVAGG